MPVRTSRTIFVRTECFRHEMRRFLLYRTAIRTAETASPFTPLHLGRSSDRLSRTGVPHRSLKRIRQERTESSYRRHTASQSGGAELPGQRSRTEEKTAAERGRRHLHLCHHSDRRQSRSDPLYQTLKKKRTGLFRPSFSCLEKRNLSAISPCNESLPICISWS